MNQFDEPVLWLMPDGSTVDKWGLQFYGGQKGTPLYTRPHRTDGSPCWCNPEVTYIDPETDASVIVHKEPQ